MRGSKLRFVCASLLAALCAALTLHGVTALAQPVPPGVGVKVVDPKAKDKKDKKDDRPAGDADLAIGFPYDRDSRNQLKAARDYLAFKDTPWKTVCPLLQNILNAGSDSFFNIDDKSGDLGSDTMTGGAGADTFHSFTGSGVDRIVDFNLADGDRLQLDPGNAFTVAQQGADTVLTLGAGDQVILVGVQMSSLPTGWIFGF